MRRFKHQILVVAVVSTACLAAKAQTPSVELLVLPGAFVVDGKSFGSSQEAVAAALSKQPLHISLPGCAAMRTQRVIDITAELRGKFAGRLTMSVVAEGERGCPRFSPSKPQGPRVASSHAAQEQAQIHAGA